MPEARSPEKSRRPTRRRRLKAPRRLRATRAGWCFVAIIFGVGFAALNTGNNLLYLVLAMLLAFLVLSGILSETALRGIRVERRLPAEIFAGVPNRVALRVYNDQPRSPALAVALEDRLSGDDEDLSAGRAFALRVGPGEFVDRSYGFTPRRRGEIHFEHVRVSTRFPFGLFVKSLELEAQAETLAYPEILPSSLSPEPLAGDTRTDPRPGAAQRGDDVGGLREFIAGDALRRVHWRRSLRAGRLLVGEREGEASGQIEVLLRVAPDLPVSVVEERIREAASAIVAHLDAGLRVGLCAPRTRIPPHTGRPHRRELLSFLAKVAPQDLVSVPDEAGEPRIPDAETSARRAPTGARGPS